MRRVRVAVAAVVALVAVAPWGSSATHAEPTSLGGGGEYHPLTPSRIFDSRPASAVNDVAPFGAKPMSRNPTPVFHVDILGKGGVPDDAGQVLAVVVNITVTEPTAEGYLQAYGKGANAGISSIVNFKAGQTVPNLALVRPGADGELTIALDAQSGTAQVIIDVFGWFSTSAAPAGEGARLIPTVPGRILDTRLVGPAPGTPLGARQSRTLTIRGADAQGPTVIDIVPDSTDVVGVVINVTAIATLATYVSVVPDPLEPGQVAGTSNVNVRANSVKANLVFVPLNDDGTVTIYNDAGSTHVLVDVVGYLQVDTNASGRRGRVVPLSTPFRAFDTRDVLFGNVPLGPGQAEDWSFQAFADSVNIDGTWVGSQIGVIGNLTNASLTRQYPTVPVVSFLTVWPKGPGLPTTSNLNSVEGQPVPNLAVLTYGPDSVVRAYNAAGFAHYLFDASAVILGD